MLVYQKVEQAMIRIPSWTNRYNWMSAEGFELIFTCWMWFWGMQRMMPKNDGWLLVWWLFGRIFHFAPFIKVRFHHFVIWGDPLTSVFGYLNSTTIICLKLFSEVDVTGVIVLWTPFRVGNRDHIRNCCETVRNEMGSDRCKESHVCLLLSHATWKPSHSFCL